MTWRPGPAWVALAFVLSKAASPRQVILLTKGTRVVYASEETELVYVTHPHWIDAQRSSEHAHLLDEFQPDGALPRR